MGNLFFCLMELRRNLVEESTHGFLSVEHVSSFLITFDVVFNFLLEIFIYSFVLEDTQKALIDL